MRWILLAIFQGLIPVLMAGVVMGQEYSVIIRGGMIYDGSGQPGMRGDVGMRGDRIEAVGDLSGVRAEEEIDARGMAVSPGFINVLSWATESLIEDGRSESDIRQGVTLEIFGEGISMGPLNGEMKRQMEEGQGDIRFEVEWTSLDEYLRFLERKGVSPNVASFVGATTVRIHDGKAVLKQGKHTGAKPGRAVRRGKG